MNVSELYKEELDDNTINKILFEGIKESRTEADCILVLGSEKAPEYRVPKAVELYQSGLAPYIMMCGGKQIPSNHNMNSEARHMRTAALKAGVPASAIILEELSMTTKENFLCAALMLDRRFRLCNIRKILLVTANYHMRRSLLMAQTYMPEWIEFIPCPAPYYKTNQELWPLSPRGRELVADEAYKVISYIREGSIPDFKI